MQISYKNQREDLTAFFKYYHKQMPGRLIRILSIICLVLIFFSGGVIPILNGEYATGIPLVLLAVIFWVFLFRKSSYAKVSTLLTEKTNPEIFKKEKKITLSSEGVKLDSSYMSLAVPWENVKAVDETETHIFIWSTVLYITIPKNKFDSPDEGNQFFRLALNFKERNVRN